MSSRLNSEVGNSSFANKKVYFNNSNFILTKEIGEYEVWTINEINQRQDRLADLAVDTWKT